MPYSAGRHLTLACARAGERLWKIQCTSPPASSRQAQRLLHCGGPRCREPARHHRYASHRAKRRQSRAGFARKRANRFPCSLSVSLSVSRCEICAPLFQSIAASFRRPAPAMRLPYARPATKLHAPLTCELADFFVHVPCCCVLLFPCANQLPVSPCFLSVRIRCLGCGYKSATLGYS